MCTKDESLIQKAAWHVEKILLAGKSDKVSQKSFVVLRVLSLGGLILLLLDFKKMSDWGSYNFYAS